MGASLSTMPKNKPGARRGKKVAAAPYTKKGGKGKDKKGNKKSTLFVAKPKNFGIGQGIQPTRDLTRYVKWPKYVRLQRQKRVLWSRLKVPPSINQFSRTLDQTTAKKLFTLLDKYKPETRAEKAARLRERAKEIASLAEGEKPSAEERPYFVKCGLNHVTSLVEKKKAKLLIIAHDVDPIELVVWLPALARRQGIPYVIVKGKARLGQVVHKKTATVLALTSVRKEHQQLLATLCESAKTTFNERYDDLRRQWGGLALGRKAVARNRKQAKEERNQLTH